MSDTYIERERDLSFQLFKSQFLPSLHVISWFLRVVQNACQEERVGKEKGLVCVIVAPVTSVYLVLFC